jgi:hypothetical protein
MADPVSSDHPSPSSTPFLLSGETVDLVKRCGTVISRFWRAAGLIEHRSSRGSLPPWISGLVRRGISARDAPVHVFQADFRLIDATPRLSLTSWQLGCDGIEVAASLQKVASDAGVNLVGGSEGIREVLHSGAISTEDGGAPLLLDNPIWLALLCSAPLQGVWGRELRASNLAFLRKLVPMSWAVDPAPLPHQAVIPRLGVRSFAEATGSLSSDLVLRPILRNSSGPSEVIRSQVTAAAWASAMNRALAEFETSPWLLQERPAFNSTPPTLQGFDLETGEAELRAYYLERDGRVTMGGIMARLTGKEKGESGEEISLLAPCGVASSDS